MMSMPRGNKLTGEISEWLRNMPYAVPKMVYGDGATGMFGVDVMDDNGETLMCIVFMAPEVLEDMIRSGVVKTTDIHKQDTN